MEKDARVIYNAIEPVTEGFAGTPNRSRKFSQVQGVPRNI